MAVYIIAALEVSMLPAMPASVQFQDVTSQERKLLAKGAKSAVTNQPLAAAFTKLLGVEVATSRSTFVQGRPGNTLLLGSTMALLIRTLRTVSYRREAVCAG